MQTVQLKSITVIANKQTVEIPRHELKVVDGGFEYADLFIPIPEPVMTTNKYPGFVMSLKEALQCKKSY